MGKKNKVGPLVKLYHVRIYSPYEAEGFADETGKLIDCWHGNDANWRDEYFSGLLKHLGAETVYGRKPSESTLRELLNDTGGDPAEDLADAMECQSE